MKGGSETGNDCHCSCTLLTPNAGRKHLRSPRRGENKRKKKKKLGEDLKGTGLGQSSKKRWRAVENNCGGNVPKEIAKNEGGEFKKRDKRSI